MQATALICHEARNYAPNGRDGPARLAARARASSRSRASTRARSCATCATAARCSAWPAARASSRDAGARAARRRAADGGPAAGRRGVRRARRPAATRARAATWSCSTTAPRPRSCACWSRPGAVVTVLPHDATAAQVDALAPDGVLLANGPGDPGSMDAHVAEVRAMVDQGRPLYGICLGHQLLGRALGLETFKLPFGHRGANHPVLESASGRVLVTSQNHGFAVQRARERRRRARGHAPLALRRHGRGPAPARPARLEHAVPPRGLARAARRAREAGRVRRGLRRRAQGGTADAAPRRSRVDRHHRLGPDRDRPGLRVRLLRRAGAQGAARRGLPHGARQLQPGHDHDRPGLGRRDLPRAARPGGRDRRAAPRAPRRAAADAGRPDGAQPRHGARARRRAGRARDRADRRLGQGHPHGRGPRGVRRRRWPRSACACRAR